MVKGVPLDKLMKELNSRKVAAEFKLCSVGIKVVTPTKADWEMTIGTLKKWKTEYYSHDFQEEKPFKSVVKGLPVMDPKLIENELLNRYKLQPIAVFPMKRKTDNRLSCPYLVHFRKGSITAGALKAVRSIYQMIVTWEQYRNTRNETQCQRCLAFGYGARNCSCKPRCANCGLLHLTTDCLHEGAVEYRCANCKGNHRGTDRSCPKRQDYREIRQRASTANQPGRKTRTAPVPVPAKNKENFPSLEKRDRPRDTTPPPKAGWAELLKKDLPRIDILLDPERNGPSRDEPFPNKFTVEKLMDIFNEFVEKLHNCKTRREQIVVLAQLVIKYGC